ncbi:MAG: hypothetical protein RBR93_10825 [Aliarcobacter butzleri]|nr:hypothetical protein [Aliarcobacter butzleri]
MKFKKYESYKDAEIDWLDEIPCNWEIKRVKDLLINNIYGTSQNTYDEGKIEILGMGDIQDGKINFPKEKFVDQIVNELLLKKGDILYTRTNGSISLIGKAGLIEDEVVNVSFASYLVRLRFRKSENSKFYNYLFNSESYRNKARSISISTAQNNLSSAKYVQVLLPTMDLKQKCEIVNYLDEKTQKIDKEISILEQKIEKYKELKQTLISETVLRGLDKNVELQECNSKWIGDIPKHWNTNRLKNIFKERVGKNLDIKTGEAVTSNILSVMKDIGVINHRDKGNVGNKMAEDITNYKLVYPNDIVVNKMNVMIGSVGISKEFGALSVVYIILITKKDSYAKYYDYFFRMKAFQRSLRRIATGILEIREAVNMTLFMQETMTKPPYDEQVKIANYLDEKTSKIDSIIEVIGKKIEVLKEFRKTLINDVVTGKVKVA